MKGSIGGNRFGRGAVSRSLGYKGIRIVDEGVDLDFCCWKGFSWVRWTKEGLVPWIGCEDAASPQSFVTG